MSAAGGETRRRNGRGRKDGYDYGQQIAAGDRWIGRGRWRIGKMMNARGAIRWCTALCGTMSLCCDERGEGSGVQEGEGER